MRNAEIAAHLDELGDLYELDGAVKYRVIAYHQAAKAVRESTASIAELTLAGRVTEVPGIGATLEQKIMALLETGAIPAAEKLRARYPHGLIEIMHLPGVGAKTARKLHDELDVASLEDLRAAAEAKRLRALPGFGPKAEENVLAAIAAHHEGGGRRRVLLSDALALAERVVAALRAHPASERVDVAGSARRMAETCHDIDIIATATDPVALARALTELDVVDEIEAQGEAGAKILSHNGIGVDLRIVAPGQYGNLLQHFSGSKAHNVALRELAVRSGMHVSEYGVKDDETGIEHTCETEAEVYRLLGMDYIEPELRENRGEIEAALEGRLPDLIGYGDVRGDLHCHTTASDGRNTILEMARAAKRLGYRYLAITDHSASHGFGNDVSPRQLARQIGRVAKANEKVEGITILAGSEVNIHPDGSLDYEDGLLGRLDWVVASLHTSFRMGERAMTERLLTAMEHPLVDAIGHPTGRLILTREPYALDLEAVIAKAAETGTMLEINANPNRRDLNEQWARRAAEAGAMVVIASDAHGADTLPLMRYGIATARRAWLTRAQVANTRTWRQFAGLRKRARLAARAESAP